MARRQPKKRQPLKFLTRFKKRLESNFDKLRDKIEQAIGGAQTDTSVQKQPVADQEAAWVATEKQHRRSQNAMVKWFSTGPMQYAQDSANSVLSIQRLVQRQFGKKPPTPEEMVALRSGAAGAPIPFAQGTNPITAKTDRPSFADVTMGGTIAKPEKPKKIGPGAPMKDLLFAGEASYDQHAATYNENFTRDTSMQKAWSDRGEKKRQFSQLARNLGHFNLSLGSKDATFNRYSELAARGTNIPEEFLSEEQVMNGMREQAGISIGGGTWLDEKARVVRHGVRKAYRFAQMAHFAQQGGAVGSMALANLSTDILTGAEQKLMDPALRKQWEPTAASLLTSASKALGGGAVDVTVIEKMVHGAGRALRLGNAAVVLGQIGLAAYDHYQQTKEKYMNAVTEGQSLVIDTNFQKYAAKVKDSSRELYNKSITGYTQAMNWAGFGESETTINAAARQRLSAAEMMAANPLAMGIHLGDKFSQYAAKKGKLVQNLSDYEKAEALEPTIKAALWNAGQDANLIQQAGDAAFNKNNDVFGVLRMISQATDVNTLVEVATGRRALGAYLVTPQMKADFQIERERLKGEFITRTGEYAEKYVGEFAFAMMRLERYKKHVQEIPEETKRLFWREARGREMAVEGQRKRRKVQNFD